MREEKLFYLGAHAGVVIPLAHGGVVKEDGKITLLKNIRVV